MRNKNDLTHKENLASQTFMNMAKIFVVLGLLLGILVLGYLFVQDNKVRKTVMENRVTNPEMVDLGVVDGCSVKHYTKNIRNNEYGSGYQEHTFYLAKCGDTTTITQRVGGKNKHDEATIIK
jgi:hypothetical protein